MRHTIFNHANTRDLVPVDHADLGPDIGVIERDGLRVLRISRSSWRRKLIYEVVLGPCKLA